jgi:hypothetical protein
VDNEILTMRELAALRKFGEQTARIVARNDELPGFKVRDQWRLQQADIDALIHTQFPSSDETEFVNQRVEDP